MGFYMIKGFYFITDTDLSRAGNADDVIRAVEAGSTMIQYRNKTTDKIFMCREAFELKALCRGIPFIINDRIDVALEVDADGVHIGIDDMSYDEAREMLGKDKIIGVSVDDLEEAKQVSAKGADYLGVGPIFDTTTKRDAGKPTGVSLIRDIKSKCDIPVIAIGGITLDTAKEVIDAGADAICAISAVVASSNVKETILQFSYLFPN